MQSISRAQTKRGKTYLRFNLVEPGGNVNKAVLWEDKALENGQVVDALVEIDEYNGEKQLNVKAIRVTANKADGPEFLPQPKIDVVKFHAELTAFVDRVSSPGIKNVLYEVIHDERWMRAPAAQKIHHAYIGGLLEHTVNLCRLGKVVSELYPILRYDYLIAAAVLHDLGKQDEMSYEMSIDYTDQGKLLGHVMIGYERLLEWLDYFEVPDDEALALKHLVISHHGNPAFGAPKAPQILEAQVFSDLDGLDAHIGTILGAIDRAGNREWTERTGTGQEIYRGRRTDVA